MEDIPKLMPVPPELEFKPSSSETKKIGVWSKCDIRKDEKYGPFEGEKKKLSAVKDDTYSWEIRGPKGRRLFSIDASDPKKGNWMRYVKSARYYDEQNMIAVQEEKNIFYKTLRIIPKGEELLCWYKGERPPANGKRSSNKAEESTKEATHIGSVIPTDENKSNDVSKDKPSSKGCSDEQTCSANEVISLTARQSISNSEAVQGACIRLSGLTDSIQRMITTTSHCSDGDRRSREPVVRLVPLSAEIKLKVHLDLDIHLDAELKTKFESEKDEKMEKTEIKFSETQQLVSDKSSELVIKGNATVKCENKATDALKYNMPSPPTTSEENEKISNMIKEEQKYQSDFLKLDSSHSSKSVNDTTKCDSKFLDTHEITLHKATSCNENLSSDLKPLESHSVEVKREAKCLEYEQTGNVVCQKLLDSHDVKCQEQKVQDLCGLETKSKSPSKPEKDAETPVDGDLGMEDKNLPEIEKDEKKVDLCLKEEISSKIKKDEKKVIQSEIGGEGKSPKNSEKDEKKAVCGYLGVEKTTPTKTEKDEGKPMCSNIGVEGKTSTKTEGVEEKPTCSANDLDVEENTQSKPGIDEWKPVCGDPGVEVKCPSKSGKDEEKVLNNDLFVEEKISSKIEKEEKNPMCKNSAASTKADSPCPEPATIDKHNAPPEKGNGAVPERRRKFSLLKKRKRFRCQQCSREFRKPFQLKMHIIRAHEKRERTFKGYKVSKRETIRTRSISYLETAIHDAFERSLKPEESIGSEAVKSQQERVSYEVPAAAATYEGETTTDKVPSDLSIGQNQITVRADVSQDTEKIEESKEIFECTVCKRTFQYQSWLSRHMLVHQKNDSVEMKPPVYTVENKIVQHSSEVTPEKNQSKDYSVNEFHIPKYDQSNLAEIQSKPFFCSECGKRFTTKKNTRRHKRLIHNILVRPDRTKLHYSNYTVEKPYTATTMKAPKKMGISTKKLFKSGKVFKRSECNRNKAHTKSGDRHSPGISVRLFDPSHLFLSETTSPQTKIQWRVSSTRTGPPPAVKSMDVDQLYRQKLKQEAAFTVTGVHSNQWTGSRRPNPFIPKEGTSKKEKTTSSAKVKVPMVSGKISTDGKRQRSDKKADTLGSSGLSFVNTKHAYSSGVIKIKQEPDEMLRRPSTTTVTNVKQSPLLTDTAHTDQRMISNLKRKLGEIHVKETDHGRAQVRRKLEEKPSFPTWLAQTSLVTPVYAPMLKASKPTQLPPLTSKLDISQLQKQPQSVLRQSLPEIQAQIRILQKEIAESEGTLPKHHKIEHTSTANPKHTFVCNVCSLRFTTPLQLNQHISMHADTWPYKCEICIQLFQMPHELMLHRKNRHNCEEVFTCNICKVKFIDKQMLEQHKEDIHGSTTTEETATEAVKSAIQSSTSYTCTKCSKQFMETSSFHSHIIDCALNGT